MLASISSPSDFLLSVVSVLPRIEAVAGWLPQYRRSSLTVHAIFLFLLSFSCLRPSVPIVSWRRPGRLAGCLPGAGPDLLASAFSNGDRD